MSRCLTDRSIDHVVIERGRVAERWRSERWKTLRLLTPNWQSRLPGWHYRGNDPDGYFTMPELVSHLVSYADSFEAPVHQHTTVLSVRHANGGGYRVVTDQGAWSAANVVVATGACDTPNVPAVATGLPAAVRQITPNRYRGPDEVEPGGVLVVGAAATGVQIACELRRAGRDVVLAAGKHTRVPRRYRGRDIYWWLDRLGITTRPIESMHNPRRAPHEPSLQLVGDPRGRTLDLARLAGMGVRLAGRMTRVAGHRVEFADDLATSCADADARMHRLLDRIDVDAAATGLDGELEPADRPHNFTPCGLTSLDLHRAGITNVVWATGYRRTYPWLHVPVLDRDGEIRHRGGLTDAPGLSVIGLPFQRRRNSAFLDGVGDDAEVLAEHLARGLDERACA